MKEGRKPECPEKTPGDELQKMPHIKARRFNPQARLEPVQYHWWQARKADMLTLTPRIAPIRYVPVYRIHSIPDRQQMIAHTSEEPLTPVMRMSTYLQMVAT